MKFSKTLQRIVEADVVYGPQYIQYKLLKKFLKVLKDGSTEEGTFVRMVESEHQRVTKIADHKLSELRMTCGGLLTNLRAQLINKNSAMQENISQLLRLDQQADEVGAQLASLQRYVIFNKAGFQKIIKKHDKRQKMSLSWMETQRLRTVFVSYLSELERLLVELSAIYQRIKENAVRGGDTAGEHAVSDEIFRRKSTKYWIHLEDVFDLKTRLVKHLPIHIFGRKSDDLLGSTTDLFEPTPEITEKGVRYDQLGWSTSVYLDNEDLDCYVTRFNMDEGATLFRVRWYGDPNDLHWSRDMCLPRAPEQGLYFERKTHHGKTSQTNSVKERFRIRESKVHQFKKGELRPEDVTKGDSSRRLAEEIQAEVLERKLHPVVRTVYKRTAFQLESCNDVRITLDTELTFVKESSCYLTESQWKRSEQDVDENGDWERFPFAVLEVKLKVTQPHWLDEILNAPCIQRKAHKATMRANDTERLRRSSSKPVMNGSVQTYSIPAFNSSDELKDIRVFRDDPISSYSEMKVFRADNGTKSKSGSNTKETSVPYGYRDRMNNNMSEKVAPRRVRIEPRTFFANERTYLQWLRTGLNLFALGGLLYNMGADAASLYSGIAFLLLAMVIMAYAVVMFYWRMNMIKYRITERFDDWFGPGMLFVIMAAALACTIVLQGFYAGDKIGPRGNPVFVCHGLASIDTTGNLVAVAMTSDTQGVEQHSLLFYNKQSRTVNTSQDLDFLSGPITGFAIVPAVLQHVLSQTSWYEGTLLVSTRTTLTAIQLYMDDHDVTVHPHIFHIPLPGNYIYGGPLASDTEYIFLVGHPSNPTESKAVLVYDISSGSLACVIPVNVTGKESGMLVQKMQGKLYEMRLLKQAPHHGLVTFELDLNKCTMKDDL